MLAQHASGTPTAPCRARATVRAVSLLGRLKTGAVRLAGWGFFDQALSSVSSFALSAVVAATVSALTGATQGLLAMGAARRSLLVEVAGVVCNRPVVAVGAAMASAAVAALATTGTAVFLSSLAWVQFGRGLSDWEAAPPANASERAALELSAI